jgi:hypothetical protein
LLYLSQANDFKPSDPQHDRIICHFRGAAIFAMVDVGRKRREYPAGLRAGLRIIRDPFQGAVDVNL